MKALQTIFVIGLFVVLVRYTAKFLLSKIVKYEKKKNNPYIKFHKLKMKNDEDYQDYLEWIKKEGSGVPIEKLLSFEDYKAEQKIKKSLSR